MYEMSKCFLPVLLLWLWFIFLSSLLTHILFYLQYWCLLYILNIFYVLMHTSLCTWLVPTLGSWQVRIAASNQQIMSPPYSRALWSIVSLVILSSIGSQAMSRHTYSLIKIIEPCLDINFFLVIRDISFFGYVLPFALTIWSWYYWDNIYIGSCI